MTAIEVDAPSGASPAGVLTARRPLPPVGICTLALIAGLVAGFASWLIGEKYHGRFDPPGPTKITSGFSSPEKVNAHFAARQAGQVSETTLAFGALGAVLGLALGLAGGFARGSAGAALIAALVGSILGGIAATAITWALQPIYYKYINLDTNDLLMAILFQGLICSVIGALGGAAFSIGLGQWKRAASSLFGGLLGAMAGVLVYEIVGAIAFPGDGVTSPLSFTSGTRLFARLAVTTLASAGAAWGALNMVKEAVSSPLSAEHHL
jgi:hypothetical protein